MSKIHRHFEDELGQLSEKILRLGGCAEDSIGRAVKALTERDSVLARAVIASDEEADRLEVEIDLLGTEILARHQPIASDLRFVTTALKIAPDLERIADLSSRIAERALELNDEPRLDAAIDLPAMATRARTMLRAVLDAFVARDAQAARAVLKLDDDLDRRMDRAFRVLLTHMLEDARLITRALRLMMVAKYFERIGDQVTNVAEMVVYMAEGRIIRHMGDQGLPHSASR